MALPANLITQKLSFQLGHRLAGVTSAFDDVYNAYDFALGGVPFMSGASGDSPLFRRSAEFKKTQIDQSSEPGEQTLAGWWLRSQSSFHGGSALKFSDVALDDSAPFRYDDSEGVDVWTLGQATLLKDTTRILTAPDMANPVLVVGARVGTADVVVWGNGLNSGMAQDGGPNYTFTYDIAPGQAFQSITSEGANVYLASKDGIWRVTLPASPGTVVATKLWAVSGTNVVVSWVKGRLMGGVDTKMYELVPPVGATPYTLPATAVYASLVPSWRWTSITSGPDAIYISGYAGSAGTILKLALDTTGALPVLTGGNDVAQLPTGEVPLVLKGYLGTFLVIGTNRGVRVGEINQTYGYITYGPLIPTQNPVWDLATRDRFIYASYSTGFSDGTSGVLRIDLSFKFSNGLYPYAKDLKVSNTGAVRSITLVGNSDRVAIGVDTSGVWTEHATNLVAQGYIKTARIRYNTLWPKIYKRLNVRGAITGTIGVSSIDSSGTEVAISNVSSASDLSADIAINYPERPQEFIAMKFYLNRQSATVGPLFRGYQVKALPGGPRAHQFVLPLMCYDYESDGNGARCGYPMFGLERLEAIELLESAGDVILLEDLNSNRQVLVVIDQVEFRQVAPEGFSDEHWGGVLTVSLRTVTT